MIMEVESFFQQCLTPHGIDEAKLEKTLLEIQKMFPQKEYLLEKFILALESYLTSIKLERRLNGIELLCKFIQLQAFYLNEAEVSLLIEFMLKRLKDHHSFVPKIVEALLCVTRNVKISAKQGTDIFTSLSKEIFSLQLGVEERFKVYQLVGILFLNHRDAFVSLKDDFLMNFMPIIEGERDPRCLIISLNLFAEIASSFNLGLLDEEFFDLAGCYFPISYNPTKDKEIKITRDDLHQRLKRCFISNKSFGKYAINLIIEKLESEMENVKCDCYDMILACVPVYGAECLSSFIPLLWTCIRIDLLKGDIGKCSAGAIKALTCLLTTIEPYPEMVENLMNDIFNDLDPALTKIDLDLNKPASNCLAAISVISPKYCSLVTENIFPLIMKHLVFNQEEKKHYFIEELTIFFQCWHQTDGQNFKEPFSCQGSIILNLISSLASPQDALQLSSLECLYHLVQCSISWKDQELESITQAILSLIIDSDIDAKIRTKVKNVLKSLTVHLPEVFNFDIISKLNIYEIISSPQDLTKVQAERLQCMLPLIKGCKIPEESLIYLIEVIITFCEKKSVGEDHKKVFLDLLDLLEGPISSKSTPIFQVKLTSYLSKMLIETEELDFFKEKFIENSSKLIPFFKENQKTTMVAEISTLLSKLKTTKPSLQKAAKQIQVLSLLLSRMPMDFVYDWLNMQDLLLELLKCLKSPEYNGLLIIIEILLNKLPENDSEMFATKLKNHAATIQDRKLAMKILVHGNRAIVVRGVKFSSIFTEDLIWTLTSDPDEKTVEYVAKYFVPLIDTVEHFRPEYGGKTIAFYAQKYFSETFPVLLRSYNLSNDWRKGFFALCLLNHLKNLPRAAMRDEISKFQSLIILNLEGNDISDNPSTALDCLTILIEMKSSLLLRNITSIVNRLIGLSKHNLYLGIRQKALRCLEIMTEYLDDMLLLPLRSTVCKELKEVLDDKKRIVRSSCANALHKWILLGQPV